jgi:nucleoside-diphosphate-sugar epimerase
VINAILLCTNIKKNLLLNICSGKEQKTHNLVKKVFKILDCKTGLVLIKKDKKKSSTLATIVGNNNKAIMNLKWKPLISIDTGLKSTIEWLKTNKNVSRYLNYE